MTEKSIRLREIGRVSIAQYEDYLVAMQVNDSGEARVSATLLLTIGELYRAMEALLDHGCASHAGGPIRSMIEALANVLLVAKDPDNVYQLTFDNAREDASLLRRYMGALGDGVDASILEPLKRMVAEAENRRDALSEAGYKKQLIATKFSEIERQVDLYTAYGILCGLVHPSFTGLMSRHAGDNKLELKYRAEPRPEVVEMLLYMAVPCLLEAMTVLPGISDIRANDVQQFHAARVAEMHALTNLA